MIAFYDPLSDDYKRGYVEGHEATVRHYKRQPRIHAYVWRILEVPETRKAWCADFFDGARWSGGGYHNSHADALEWALNKVKEAVE